jgi:hypothetical protein
MEVVKQKIKFLKNQPLVNPLVSRIFTFGLLCAAVMPMELSVPWVLINSSKKVIKKLKHSE